MGERARTWRSPHAVDVGLTIGLIRRGPGDPLFRRDGDWTWRTTRTPDGPATLALRQQDERTVEARAWGPGADAELEQLPRLLGTDDDTSDFAPAHPVVLDAHRRFPGLRTPATGRVVEALMPAIIEQKVLGTDAFRSQRQLSVRHGDPAPGPAPSGMRVPLDAATWAGLAQWDWHRAGVDPKRYRAAQAAARHASSFERIAATGDHAALYRALRSIPGVGTWTAAEVGSRALGDADAVPWGDYHLGRTVGSAMGAALDLDDHQVAELLEPYRPHRGRVVRLLQLSPLVRVERRGPRMSRVDHRGI